MEASKRERIVLFGVVPVASVSVGSIATVVATKMLGPSAPGDAIVEIVRSSGLTAADKARLIELANKNDQQFYDFLRTWLMLLTPPLGVIVWAVADWIRKR